MLTVAMMDNFFRFLIGAIFVSFFLGVLLLPICLLVIEIREDWQEVKSTFAGMWRAFLFAGYRIWHPGKVRVARALIEGARIRWRVDGALRYVERALDAGCWDSPVVARQRLDALVKSGPIAQYLGRGYGFSRKMSLYREIRNQERLRNQGRGQWLWRSAEIMAA